MALTLSLLVLTAIALVIGAVFLWRRGGSRLHAVLMLVLAAVIAGNVAIWVMPQAGGSAPVDRVLR